MHVPSRYYPSTPGAKITIRRLVLTAAKDDWFLLTVHETVNNSDIHAVSVSVSLIRLRARVFVLIDSIHATPLHAKFGKAFRFESK